MGDGTLRQPVSVGMAILHGCHGGQFLECGRVSAATGGESGVSGVVLSAVRSSDSVAGQYSDSELAEPARAVPGLQKADIPEVFLGRAEGGHRVCDRAGRRHISAGWLTGLCDTISADAARFPDFGACMGCMWSW